MKDLQKIKEFFSKPLNEESTTFKVGDKVTYLGHPAEITAVNKEMTGAITYNVAYNKGQGRTKASNINRDDIKRLNEAKSNPSLDEAKKENEYPIVIAKKATEYGWKPKYYVVGEYNNDSYILIPIDRFNEWEKTNLNKKPGFNQYEEIVSKSEIENSMNEAKEEDKVDTITMDIPLFLRMLEYSREDASQDMDLHDVTEKANLLGKERGILQMDDYDEIVGTAEDIKEGSTTFKVGDIVSKKYASTDEDYTKKFKIIDITGMRATLQDIKTGKQTGIALSDLTERIINRLKNDPRRTKR